MSLKTKRSLPILLLLVAALMFFSIVLGNQRLGAYRVIATGQPTQQTTTITTSP